jgi:hypothetical protein
MQTTPLTSTAAVSTWLFAILVLLVAGCDTGPGSSLYDPDRPALPTPIISGISPESPPSIVLAGVDTVTIVGQHFSPEISNNLVYFDATRASVVEASATQLRVRVPYLPSQEISVKATVLGALEYSNTWSYQLLPPAVRFGGLGRNEEPFGMGTDDDGNVYVSLFAEGSSIGIKRFSPDGTRADYFASTFAWTDLAIGPDGALYGVRGVRAVFRLPEGGTQQTFRAFPAGVSLNALTFDSEGVLWASNQAGSVYSLDGGGTERNFPLAGTVQDIAVFAGSLYAAVTQDGVSSIVRLPITAPGELGAPQPYAAISASFGSAARRIAFSEDGTLIVGTASAPSLVAVRPGGFSHVLYPGRVGAPVRAMAWGAGTTLYALARVVGNEDSEARQLPDLIGIETRMEGGE